MSASGMASKAKAEYFLMIHPSEIFPFTKLSRVA